MIKNVRIREKDNNKVIGEFQITLEIDNPAEDDFHQFAWDNAVDLKVVDENRRSDYQFDIINDTSCN